MAWKGVITNSGIELLAQWTTGKMLTISRAAAGTGRVSETALMAQTALVSEKQAASILSNRTTEQGQKLQLQVTPQTLGYTLNQIGVWAQLDGGAETMIALFQTDTDAGVEIPSKENVPDYVYTFYGLMQFAGADKDLQVTIDPDVLVTRTFMQEILKAHTDRKDNPHGVSKEQVGLGNVPNVATNDQTPTYTAATELNTLTSGEKLSVSMGKIMKAILDLISHMSNKRNPHEVTKGQVGLGNVPNVATNDQTPTYTAATTLAPLTSGEKLSVAMGKIAKAIADLISHIADTTKHITAAERKAWNGKAAGSHTHDDRYYTETETDNKLKSYLPLAGGTLTGNLTGKYIAGTWLRITEDNHMANTPAKVAVLDGSGWVYYRTVSELLADLGIPDAASIRATTAVYGTTKLSTSITSTSKTTAATPYAVKAALDKAKQYTDDQIKVAINSSY